jgi:ubiquitin-activating enzyme E1
VKPPQLVNSFLSEPNYLENSLKYSGQQAEQAEQILESLVTQKPLTFTECIVWARLLFEDKYKNAIQQLLFSLPKDATTTTGQPFWSGPKRAPDPLAFDSSDVSNDGYLLRTALMISSSLLTSHSSSPRPTYAHISMG